MRRPDPIKLDIVREEILSAAMNLFQKYGINKTTMEDIAEAAGKGKSTLYYYFKKKDDVFFAVAKREISSLNDIMAKEIKSGKTAVDKVRLFFMIQDKSLRSKVKLYPMIFKEPNKHIHLFHNIQRLGNTLQTNVFKDILLEGIESGEFKSISKKDCNTIAVTAVAILHAMQLTMVLDGKMPSNEDKLEVVHRIMVRGLK